jgi:Domain of unknown function (DUF4136)
MAKFDNLVRKSFLVILPAVALMTAGCTASPFRAEVSRFQQLPPAQGQTFAITAADTANRGGIEFDQYASLVSAQMTKLGYVPSSPQKNADLTVLLGYGVDKGKERIVRDPFYDPYWGYRGLGSGFGYGGYYPYGLHSRYNSRFVYGFYDPFLFGGAGFGRDYGTDSFTVYTGDIDLKIKRNSDGQNLFEGKAEAKSRSNKLPYLVPNLVEAMFTGFPGNNGETVRISVAPEPKGKR